MGWICACYSCTYVNHANTQCAGKLMRKNPNVTQRKPRLFFCSLVSSNVLLEAPFLLWDSAAIPKYNGTYQIKIRQYLLSKILGWHRWMLKILSVLFLLICCVSMPLYCAKCILYDFLRCVSYYHFFDCNFLWLQSFRLSLHQRFFQIFGHYEQYDCQISPLSVWPEVFCCLSIL